MSEGARDTPALNWSDLGLRLVVFIGKRHKCGRGFGWSVLAYKSIDQCGLLSLDGAVIAPRADKPWREKPNAGGERRR